MALAPSETQAEELIAELETLDQGHAVSDMAAFVDYAAREAAAHRQSTGIQRRLQEAINAVNNKYNADECELIEDADIYMPVTSMKVRAFRSWLTDILVHSEDKPWTIAPTPVPDLPESLEDVVIDTFINEVAEFGFEGSFTTRLSELKRIAESHLAAVAQDSATKMEATIHDQLLEGGWREALTEFIDDLGTYPGAVLKGPFVEMTKELKWEGDKAVAVMRPTYKVARVSPFDIFPSPDSSNTQDGSYIIERMRLCRPELMAAANLSGFDEVALRALAEQHPQGWAWCPGADHVRDEGEGTDETKIETGGVYEVLVYHGKVAGSELLDWEVDGLADKVDRQNAYEMEIWSCGGYVIRAIMNPHPLCRRPYNVASFDHIPGSFWGRGLPDLLRDVQRSANATARALIRNMAFSAGPIGEVDVGRLAQEENVDEIEPYRLFKTEADPLMPQANRAFHFHNVDSNAGELMGIYERFMTQADDISGIPAYVLGNPDVAGAGRTLGGLSLLMGNAAKGIKNIISQVDKRVIEPMVEEYVVFNLLYSEEADIKFDLNVVARGSTGLLQRELSQSRAVELLQVLAPLASQGIVEQEGIKLVVRDIIRGLGYREDDIAPLERRADDLAGFLAGAGLGGGAASTPESTLPGTPGPALDGRSAAAFSVNDLPIPPG